MSYKHTLADIQAHSGLKLNFIRRCLSEMKEVFKPHISKGENNSILVDDSTFVLFDQIKQLKQNGGLSLPEIKSKLNYELVKPNEAPSQSGCETLSNQPVKPDEETAIKGLYERLLEEKERGYQALLNAKNEVIASLQSQVRLLTDGRDPEVIRREVEEKRKRRAEIVAEIERIEGHLFKSKKRKRLFEELKSLDP
ncbi:MAG: hypothetical protein HQK94_19045 [Nitrospirae bacterium]|nr:hypothetical protein [Nitrospirota bacterium]